MGDNMATRARARGVAGVIVDGALRDLADVRAMGLPVYARTAVCRTAAGRMLTLGLDTPVVCGGVWIRPGDVVVGDEDGVVVVPRGRASEVAALAEELEKKERLSKAFLADGHTLVEAIQTYKVRGPMRVRADRIGAGTGTGRVGPAPTRSEAP
jgi:regulator of RNase E activity RraA